MVLREYTNILPVSIQDFLTSQSFLSLSAGNTASRNDPQSTYRHQHATSYDLSSYKSISWAAR